MALEFCDGFDLYNNSVDSSHTTDVANSIDSLLRRWTITNPTNIWTSTVLTRNIGVLPTGGALNIPLGSGIVKTLSQQNRWLVGFGYYYQAGNVNQAGGVIYEILGGSPGNNISLFKVRLNNDGTFSIYAGTNLINTSLTAITVNQWYYIEFDIALSGTTNISVQASLYVDSVRITAGSAATGVGQASLAAGTTTANVHSLSSGGNTAGTGIFDDLYICNGTGIVNNNAVLGPIKICLVHPNADAGVQFTRSAGGANFSLVNETPQDMDTTWVNDIVVGQKDIYDWDDVPATANVIVAIQVSVIGRNLQEGHAAVQQVVGATGGEAQSSSDFFSNTYRWYTYPLDSDPGPATPWIPANFNAKQFGLKVV